MKVARDIFVHECIEHAAEHEHKIFIAYPLVFSYLHELFWPRVRPETKGTSAHSAHSTRPRANFPPSRFVRTESVGGGGGGGGRVGGAGGGLVAISYLVDCAKVGGMLLANAALLPLLPLMPDSMEDSLEIALRKKVRE